MGQEDHEEAPDSPQTLDPGLDCDPDLVYLHLTGPSCCCPVMEEEQGTRAQDGGTGQRGGDSAYGEETEDDSATLDQGRHFSPGCGQITSNVTKPMHQPLCRAPCVDLGNEGPPDLPLDPENPPDLLYDQENPPDLPLDPETPPDLPLDLEKTPDLLHDPATPRDMPLDPETPPDLPLNPETPPDLPLDSENPPVMLQDSKNPPDPFQDPEIPPDLVKDPENSPDLVQDPENHPDPLQGPEKPSAVPQNPENLQEVPQTPMETLKSEEEDDGSSSAKRTKEHQAKLDFALKLGYSEDLVRTVLTKLGPHTLINDVLGELVRLGTRDELDPVAGSARGAGTEAGTVTSSCGCGDEGKEESSEEGESLQDNLRPVVVDGSNVAMSHGNKEVFSCQGIQLAVDWFLERGHHDITVFVPAWRKEQSRPDAPITDQEILRRLERQKVLVFTPSRRVQGRRVVCYDDRFIVKLAFESDGIIVSNDNYRDLANERPEWKRFIEDRLLMYSFVNDKFMPPDDPLGRHGPSLENFLRKRPVVPEQKKQPCPYGKKCTYGHKCKYFHPERGAQPQRAVADELRASAKTGLAPKAQSKVQAKTQADAGLVKSHSVPCGEAQRKGSGHKRQSDPSVRALSYSDAEERLLLKNLSRTMSPAPGGPPTPCTASALPQDELSRSGTPHAHQSDPQYPLCHSPEYYCITRGHANLSLSGLRPSPDLRVVQDLDYRLGPELRGPPEQDHRRGPDPRGPQEQDYRQGPDHRATQDLDFRLRPDPRAAQDLEYRLGPDLRATQDLDYRLGPDLRATQDLDYRLGPDLRGPPEQDYRLGPDLRGPPEQDYRLGPDLRGPPEQDYRLGPDLRGPQDQDYRLGLDLRAGSGLRIPQDTDYRLGSLGSMGSAGSECGSESSSCDSCPPDSLPEDLYHPHGRFYAHPHECCPQSSEYPYPPPPDAPPKRPLYPLPLHLHHRPLSARSSCPGDYHHTPPLCKTALPDSPLSRRLTPSLAESISDSRLHEHFTHLHTHPHPHHPRPKVLPHWETYYRPPLAQSRYDASSSSYWDSFVSTPTHYPPLNPSHPGLQGLPGLPHLRPDSPARAREKLYMNLCNIFPSELVGRVMSRSPHLTDPQQLAAAILAEKALCGF